MKKKFSVFVICLALAICGAAFGGCAHGFKNATKLHYVEWSDAAGNMSFRVADNTNGYGYIKLGGVEVAAEFQFIVYKCCINVIVNAKDLDENDPRDKINESFAASDVDGDGKIKSSNGNVVLFGYDFGTVVLSYTQLSREDFDEVGARGV